MKRDSSESEESDQSLKNRLGHAHQRGGEGGAHGGAEELREGEDAAGQHQDDERRDETGLCVKYVYFWFLLVGISFMIFKLLFLFLILYFMVVIFYKFYVCVLFQKLCYSASANFKQQMLDIID